MKKLNSRQERIIQLIKTRPGLSFQSIYESLGELGGERTIKRDLSELVSCGFLVTSRGGRSLVYEVPISARLFIPIDAVSYAAVEPDQRQGALANYQFALWNSLPESLFNEEQLKDFDLLTSYYQRKIAEKSADIRHRELERFVIELSWKSSRIEGNTYTLLDTERLIREGVESGKNTKEESIMILNHKDAFEFIYKNGLGPEAVITRAYIEEVHSLLMQGLISDTDMRKHAVGITGSLYHPLDNQFQIQEALTDCISAINSAHTTFDKALLTLVGLSYIQPFVDGNKRTARLVANGILLAGQAAPLSYRNVDEVTYRASLLTFYEQLSILPMRDIFTEQYQFAVKNYS